MRSEREAVHRLYHLVVTIHKDVLAAQVSRVDTIYCRVRLASNSPWARGCWWNTRHGNATQHVVLLLLVPSSPMRMQPQPCYASRLQLEQQLLHLLA